MEHFFLQGNVDLLVGVAIFELGIVKGEHEGVGEEDPYEALGIEVVGHHGAIGDSLLDVEFVENHVEVGGAGVLLF